MKRYFSIIMAAFFTAITVGCQEDVIEIKHDSREVGISQTAVIGNKLPNPLAIDNIVAAFNALDSQTKAGLTENDFQATHHYIAFTPRNDEENNAIYMIDDEDMVFSTYPLDYEISDGFVMPDPRFMTDGFSYRWAYVPVDYDLSEIDCPYIHYYDIYDPDGMVKTKAHKDMPQGLLDAVLEKSYEICGLKLLPAANTKAGNVIPSGRILFWNSSLSSYKGIDGLSIRTYRGAHSSYCHCNDDGTFISDDSFRYAFNYEIHFSRTDFVIRKNDATSELTYLLSNYIGPLYQTYTSSDTEAIFFANISSAAIDYYYGESFGMRRPPMKSDSGSYRLLIQGFTSFDPNGNAGYYQRPQNWNVTDRPRIRIYHGDSSTGVYKPKILYANTSHELGHASHWRGNPNYFSTTSIVKESFAKGVEWLRTRAVYPTYNADYCRMSYTGIFEDLIDGYGPTESYFYGILDGINLISTPCTKSYNDHVTGYSPSQIEEMVRISTQWDNLRLNIGLYYFEIEDFNDLTEAFNYWNSAN